MESDAWILRLAVLRYLSCSQGNGSVTYGHSQ